MVENTTHKIPPTCRCGRKLSEVYNGNLPKREKILTCKVCGIPVCPKCQKGDLCSSCGGLMKEFLFK